MDPTGATVFCVPVTVVTVGVIVAVVGDIGRGANCCQPTIPDTTNATISALRSFHLLLEEIGTKRLLFGVGRY